MVFMTYRWRRFDHEWQGHSDNGALRHARQFIGDAINCRLSFINRCPGCHGHKTHACSASSSIRTTSYTSNKQGFCGRSQLHTRPSYFNYQTKSIPLKLFWVFCVLFCLILPRNVGRFCHNRTSVSTSRAAFIWNVLRADVCLCQSTFNF